MIALAERLWPAIALAGVLGLLLTTLLGAGRSSPSASRFVSALAFGALLAAGILVWLQTVPGRPGLWLETAVLVLFAYAVGCALGAVLRRAVLSGRSPPPPSPPPRAAKAES